MPVHSSGLIWEARAPISLCSERASEARGKNRAIARYGRRGSRRARCSWRSEENGKGEKKARVERGNCTCALYLVLLYTAPVRLTVGGGLRYSAAVSIILLPAHTIYASVCTSDDGEAGRDDRTRTQSIGLLY